MSPPRFVFSNPAAAARPPVTSTTPPVPSPASQRGAPRAQHPFFVLNKPKNPGRRPTGAPGLGKGEKGSHHS